MPESITVSAAERNERGKNAARRLRVQGRIPGVVYGRGKKAVAVSLDPKMLWNILHSGSGHNTIFSLDLGGKAQSVMIKEYQLDPIKGSILHADLLTIAMDQKMKFEVPIEIDGEPRGVKLDGGILDVVVREVQVECLPGDVPDHILVDVRELGIHDTVRVKELIVDTDKIRILSDPELTLVTVAAPRAEEVVAPVAETVVAEPEVIKKGKIEEEGAEKEEKKKEEKKKDEKK